MSISPKEKEPEQFKPTIVQKTGYIVKGFFEKPCFYMFFIFLFAMMIGFLFEAHYPWQFYVVLIILGITQAIGDYEKTISKN